MNDHLPYNQNHPSIVVVDQFFKDPDAIRRMALSLEFNMDDRYYKGYRSRSILLPGVREYFQQLIGGSIKDWMTAHATNGCFQWCPEGTQIVYHSDSQAYAAAIYLTPNPPPGTGTSFWRSKLTGDRLPSSDPEKCRLMYEGNLLSPDNWELVDRVENVYNRCAIWAGPLVHSASGYFGKTKEDSRLVQLHFFELH